MLINTMENVLIFFFMQISVVTRTTDQLYHSCPPGAFLVHGLDSILLCNYYLLFLMAYLTKLCSVCAPRRLLILVNKMSPKLCGIKTTFQGTI